MTRAALTVLAALAAAGCGGLETPDLASGTVSGRLANAHGAAYVYPLGRPDLKTPVAADGRYAIAGVPAGARSLVVVDRDPEYASSCNMRLVEVEVRSAEDTEVPDVDAETELFPAGEVVAAVQPAGGAASGETRFTVVGTDVDVVTTTGVAVLWPLPPNDPSGEHDPLAPAGWRLAVDMKGFRAVEVELEVTAAATREIVAAVEIELEDAARGCVSAGCRTGFVCDASDGTCRECLSDAQCTGGATCFEHVCRVSGAGSACAPCASSADCAGGAACIADGVGALFCAASCTAPSECAAGFDCVSSRCRPKLPGTCDTYRASLGAPCWSDGDCGALVGNTCAGASPSSSPPKAGYCTAQCTSSTQCGVVPGYACGPVAGLSSDYCVRSP